MLYWPSYKLYLTTGLLQYLLFFYILLWKVKHGYAVEIFFNRDSCNCASSRKGFELNNTFILKRNFFFNGSYRKAPSPQCKHSVAPNCKSTWSVNQVSSPNPPKCDWLKYMRLVFPKCNKLCVVCFFIFSLLSLLHKFHGNHERDLLFLFHVMPGVHLWSLGLCSRALEK